MGRRCGAAVLAVLLCGTAVAQQPEPAAVLDRTSKYVSAFLDQFSEVKCTERVSQQKLTKNGKVEYTEESSFDYLVIMQGKDDDFLLSESRLQEKEAKHSKNLPLLVTNGFSMMFLVFHPYYRESFTYSPAGDATVNGRRYERVRFDHLLGRRTPIALAVRGREFPLEITGTALLDPTDGSIAHMEATLAAPMDDIGLRAFTTVVDYVAMPQMGLEQAYRFPTIAMVDIETLKQHWRNTHYFTDYKRFSVSTDVAVADKK